MESRVGTMVPHTDTAIPELAVKVAALSMGFSSIVMVTMPWDHDRYTSTTQGKCKFALKVVGLMKFT